MKNKNDDLAKFLSKHADDNYCYLTTTGRKSGSPHEIEIWFGIRVIHSIFYPKAEMTQIGSRTCVQTPM